MPLYARLGPYDQALLHRMASDGELIEGWIHEASFLPMRDHRLFEWRRQDARNLLVSPNTKRWVSANEALVDNVLAQIRDRGALSGRDIQAKSTNRGPWWGWGDTKIALEWLFRTGAVGALRNHRFERRYELIERIIPTEIATLPALSRDQAHRELLRMAAGHLGVATAVELADYHRLQITEARHHIRDLVEDGDLMEVSVQNWTSSGYVPADWKRTRRDSISTLISPFDPVTWYRDRAEQLFGFRYRIEIYTPKPRRVYGYYVLPFVHRNGLRARVDLKLDRKESLLRVLSTWGESHDDDPADTIQALGIELQKLATFLGAAGLAVEAHGDLGTELVRQVG